MNAFLSVADAISSAAIPFVVAAILLVGMLRKVAVYEVFVEGAKEGFETAVRIIPYLVAVLLAVGMVRAAGLLDALAALLAPVLNAVGVPPEALPMALIRPLSGSGADGVLVELMVNEGPDSLAATTAAVMGGSTETTFYVLAVYFGSVGIQRIRHALWAGLAADLCGVLAASWLTRIILFGG